MAKHIWQTHELITAELMNGLEERIASESAYEAAKRGGYTSSEEDFYELLGNSANYLSETRSAADEAINAWNNIQNKNAPMVAAAEQFLTDIGTIDEGVYSFRVSGGNNNNQVQKTEINSIVGGTIVWNQLQKNDMSHTTDGVTFTYSNGTLTVATATVPSENVFWIKNIAGIQKWDFVAGHVYLLDCGNSTYVATSNTSRWYIPNLTDGVLTAPIKIVKPESTISEKYFQYTVKGGEEINTVFRPQIFDLTQMFGSDIADYIYSLDQGAGYDYFRRLFSNPWYAYDSGTLRSVQAASHKTVGFNLFDKTAVTDGYYLSTTTGEPEEAAAYYITDYIRVIKSVPVRIPASGSMRRWFYDMSKKASVYINSSNAQTYTPPADGYIRVSFKTAEYPANGVCIHLAWDGERNGEYEAYSEHVYPLDPDLELRGIPQVDAEGHFSYDGDTYEDNGTVTRKYDIVDLGTLNWMAGSNNTQFYTSLTDATNEDGVSAICVKYINHGPIAGDWESLGVDEFAIYNTTLRVYPSTTYVDAATFKTAMSDVYLIYKLATPTTESANPYTNPQIVDNWGTEEYIDTRDVPIPVGHKTVYQANINDLVENIVEEQENIKEQLNTLISSNVDDLSYILGVN